jgi:hypothetical protein
MFRRFFRAPLQLAGTAEPHTLTSVNAKPIAATMTRTVGPQARSLGVLAAWGGSDDPAGCFGTHFVRNYIAMWFCPGPRVRKRKRRNTMTDGMDLPTVALA